MEDYKWIKKLIYDYKKLHINLIKESLTPKGWKSFGRLLPTQNAIVNQKTIAKTKWVTQHGAYHEYFKNLHIGKTHPLLKETPMNFGTDNKE
jgi:hypothetical protein